MDQKKKRNSVILKLFKLKENKMMKIANIKNMLVAGAAGVTALVGGSTSSVVTAAAVGAVAGGLYGDSKDKK